MRVFFYLTKKTFGFLVYFGIFLIIILHTKSTDDESDQKTQPHGESLRKVLFKEPSAQKKLHNSDFRNLVEPTDLKFENTYWQVFTTVNGTFRLLNAYYDDRDYLRGRPLIRIMAVQSRTTIQANLFCYIWYDGIDEPTVSKVHEYRLLWFERYGPKTNFVTPVFISCLSPLVDQGKIPASVSLFSNEFETPSNNLKVIHILPENGIKKTVAVCGRLFEYKADMSMILIEWIEIVLLLGADMIVFSVITIHSNMMRVLSYYEDIGKVKIERLTLPNAKTLPRYNQMIAINDCFYKNMYKYKFITSLDIDEFIVPMRLSEKTWQSLLQRKAAKSKKFVSLEAQSVFFNLDNNHQDEVQPEVPKNLIFLQHVYRASELCRLEAGAKSFVRTDSVIVTHNHRAIHCAGYCSVFHFSPGDARLQHYRNGCGGGYAPEKCDYFRRNTTRDTILWKFKDEVVKNVYKTAAATGIEF